MRVGLNPQLIYRLKVDKKAKKKVKQDGAKVQKSDIVVGVSLSADYCAEHEWGIKELRREFGLPDDEAVFGSAKRQITCTPAEPDFRWFDNDKEYKGFGFMKQYEKTLWTPSDNYNKPFFYNKTLWAAWDSRSFAVVSKDKDEIESLQAIYEAVKINDAVIWLGGGGPFENSGLCIGILSNMPKNVLDQWYQIDKERYEVDQEVKATGIKEKLQEAGKRYYALSPRREDNGSLIFWLNPMDQHIHNTGWFKLKDLEDWIQNKGKIPMTEKQKQEKKERSR